MNLPPRDLGEIRYTCKEEGPHSESMCTNRYVLTGKLLVPAPPVSSARSRWGYEVVTDLVLHFLTTDPAAPEPGWHAGNGKSLPPHHTEYTAVVVHQGGMSSHCVAASSKHHTAVN